LGKPAKTAAKSVSTSSTLANLTNSPFFPAYEHAKTILDTGGDIDDQLWAKLIKCRILDLKKEVQNRTARKPVCNKNLNFNFNFLIIKYNYSHQHKQLVVHLNLKNRNHQVEKNLLNQLVVVKNNHLLDKQVICLLKNQQE
jgi:hypothetical protein